jgi:hypothetical protein
LGLSFCNANGLGFPVVAVVFFEVVEPFFSLRLHPNTSLRKRVRRLPAAAQVHLWDLTPGFFCDRLALHGRLNQIDARPRKPGPGATSD